MSHSKQIKAISENKISLGKRKRQPPKNLKDYETTQKCLINADVEEPLEIVKPKRQKKKGIYFLELLPLLFVRIKKNVKDIIKVRCLLCGDKNATFVLDNTKSNQVKHLSAIHESFFQEVQDLIKNQLKSYEEVKARCTEELQKIVAQKRYQQSNIAYVKVNNIMNKPLATQQRLIASVLFFVNSGIPFINFDDDLLRFWQSLSLRDALNQWQPGRTTMRNTYFPLVYAAIGEQVRKTVQDLPCIALTGDCWTDNGSSKKYLAVQGHWLDDEFVCRTALLGMEPLIDRATTNQLSIYSNTLINKWLPEGCNTIITSFTTDNEKAMSNCGEIVCNTKNGRIPCFAHTANLIIKDFCKKPIIEGIVTQINSISKKLHNKSEYKKLFSKLSFDAKYTKLIRPVATRWASEYYVAKRILDCKEAVEQIPDLVTNSFMEKLTNFVITLQPLASAIEKAEGDYITMPFVCKSVLQLYDECEPTNGCAYYETCFKKILMPLLKSRLDCFVTVTKDKDPPLSICAAALTPRYHKLEFLSKEAIEQVWKYIIKDAALFFSPEDEEIGHPEQILQPALLRNYMSKNEDKTIYQFWRRENTRKTFPKFFELARLYFGIPATQAASERTFSTAGFFDRRASFQSTSIEDFVFIKKNIHWLGATAEEKVATVIDLMRSKKTMEQELHNNKNEEVEAEQKSATPDNDKENNLDNYFK